MVENGRELFRIFYAMILMQYELSIVCTVTDRLIKFENNFCFYFDNFYLLAFIHTTQIEFDLINVYDSKNKVYSKTWTKSENNFEIFKRFHLICIWKSQNGGTFYNQH